MLATWLLNLVVGLEWIPDYPDNYLQTEHSDVFLRIRVLSLMFAHAHKPTMWDWNCNQKGVDKCLALFHQLFWLIDCRTICKKTNASCINIYCTWLQQKGEVTHKYVDLETSYFISYFLNYYLYVHTRYWNNLVVAHKHVLFFLYYSKQKIEIL